MKSITLITVLVLWVASSLHAQVFHDTFADSLIDIAKQDVKLAQSSNDIEQIIESARSLATLLHEESNYVDEIEVLLEGLKYLDGKEYLTIKADFLLTMGEASRATRKFESGLEYLDEAEHIYETTNNVFKLAKTFNRKAAIYFEFHLTDSKQTFEYANRSIALAKKLDDFELLASNYDILGAEYRRRKEYRKSLDYLHKVIQLYESNNQDPFPNVYINLCILNLRLKKYDESIKYGEKAIGIIGEHGSKYQLETVTDFLSSAYYASGDYKNAYHYAILSNHYESIQFNEKRDAKIEELNKKYHTEKQESQIKLQLEKIKTSTLEAEKRRLQRNVFIIALGVMIVLALFVFRMFKQKKNAYALLELQKQEIEKVNAELAKSNSTKDRFLSIIAHDLRSPFSTLCGFSKILTERFDQYDIPKQKLYLAYIDSGINKTFKLLEDLLVWARSQKDEIAFEPQDINLFLVANDNCELFNETTTNKSIQLTNSIQEDCSVVADEHMISTVFRNLISNALKFTPQGGKVVVTAEDLGGHIAISIKDNGLGMSKDVQGKLFDIAESVSTKGTNDEDGTGLGLVLVKEFISRHNGSVWAESELNKGSVFTFTIPKNIPNSSAKHA